MRNKEFFFQLRYELGVSLEEVIYKTITNEQRIDESRIFAGPGATDQEPNCAQSDRQRTEAIPVSMPKDGVRSTD
jgi:hypothetical protein